MLSLELDGDELVVTIVQVDEEEVVLDANHPLAGKPVVFELLLLDE